MCLISMNEFKSCILQFCVICSISTGRSEDPPLEYEILSKISSGNAKDSDAVLELVNLLRETMHAKKATNELLTECLVNMSKLEVNIGEFKANIGKLETNVSESTKELKACKIILSTRAILENLESSVYPLWLQNLELSNKHKWGLALTFNLTPTAAVMNNRMRETNVTPLQFIEMVDYVYNTFAKNINECYRVRIKSRAELLQLREQIERIIVNEDSEYVMTFQSIILIPIPWAELVAYKTNINFQKENQRCGYVHIMNLPHSLQDFPEDLANEALGEKSSELVGYYLVQPKRSAKAAGSTKKQHDGEFFIKMKTLEAARDLVCEKITIRNKQYPARVYTAQEFEMLKLE